MHKDLMKINEVEGKISFQECCYLNRLTGKVLDEFGKESALVEIGSYCGRSTISIACCLSNKGCGLLYAIDWHEGSPSARDYQAGQYQSTFERYSANLKKFGVEGRVITIRKKSNSAFEDVPDRIHFLWIDGSHVYEDVKMDFKNYGEKLVNGGYLLFHDACWPGWPGPFKVISEEVLDHKSYNLYASIGNIVVFKKEKNRTPKLLRNIFRILCKLTVRENRGTLASIVSTVFYRLSGILTFLLKR